jgi:hypothetical protein
LDGDRTDAARSARAIVGSVVFANSLNSNDVDTQCDLALIAVGAVSLLWSGTA